MIRTEVIANRAVKDDLLEEFKKRSICSRYTLLDQVFGVGNSGERWGDHIWPEENILILSYTSSEKEALELVQAVRSIKERFPIAGIKLFQFKMEAEII